MAASGTGGSLMNAPGGGEDAGGSLRSSRQAYLSYGNSTSEKTTGHSLPACVERPVLRTTWTILDTTCVKKRFSAHGKHGRNKKKKSGAFHKGPDPYIKRT